MELQGPKRQRRLAHNAKFPVEMGVNPPGQRFNHHMSKLQVYSDIAEDIKALGAPSHHHNQFKETSRHWVTDLANACAVIHEKMVEGSVSVNWCGFYLKFPDGEELALGPFQGKTACTGIPLNNKGVCASVARQMKPVVVPDCHAWPGHISCDAASQSEIVIPLITSGKLVGVLDIDSPKKQQFSQQDVEGLTQVCDAILANIQTPWW